MSDVTPRKISKITIDRSKCIGAATCVVIAPNGFELDDQGISTVKKEFLTHTDEDLLKAVRSCPSGAITAFDENGNEIKFQ